MNTCKIARPLATLGCLFLATVNASAATLEFDFECAPVPVAAVRDGAPACGVIFRYFVTTSHDILSVNQVLITGPAPFQVAPPFGSNTEPPPPEFIALRPSLLADSWITTPGVTSRLGPDMPGDGTSTWGDLTNDGPQTRFQFAQLTTPSGFGRFQGRISLAGDTGPVAFPFDIPAPLDYSCTFECVPEPSGWCSATIGIGLFLMWTRGRFTFPRRCHS
jgi:hypothetical protein